VRTGRKWAETELILPDCRSQPKGVESPEPLGRAPVIAVKSDTVYNADTLFAGGRTYKTSSSLRSTVDDALYQTERYGNFSYAIPPPNGEYKD
jgi:hypothetical protein